MPFELKYVLQYFDEQNGLLFSGAVEDDNIPIISDSANTTQVEFSFGSLVDLEAIAERSETSQSKRIAVISKKRPVPAAHLSFITKSFTFPLSVRVMILESCPPISIIVFASGK